MTARYVPWRLRGVVTPTQYADRLRFAAWAFGRNGMLPPSYTRRPGVNPDRHARIRMRHFAYADDAAMFSFRGGMAYNQAFWNTSRIGGR